MTATFDPFPPINPRLLAALALALAGLIAFQSRGTVVTGQLADIHLEPLDTPLVFSPASNVFRFGNTLQVGPPRAAYSTNGVFHLTLAPGPYTVTVPLSPARRPFAVVIPEASTNINLADLVTASAEPFLPGPVPFFAADFLLETNTRTARTDAPVFAPDAVALVAGGQTQVRAPAWATQAMSSVLLQWSGGAPLFWTNRAESVSYADPAGPESHTTLDLPLRLTNHFNRVLFTNAWPAEAPLKVLSLQSTLAPTNIATPVYLLEWQVRWLGNPPSQP